MYEGGCACGNVRYESGGDVQATVLCHCDDCRKIGGFTTSHNTIVPEDKFKVTKGTPKEWTKKADGGNEITSCFCGDCGSTMWRQGTSFPNQRLIKSGTLDDKSVVDSAHVNAELYVKNKPHWLHTFKDADQKNGMS